VLQEDPTLASQKNLVNNNSLSDAPGSNLFPGINLFPEFGDGGV